jgi:hypothetical protein
MKAIINALQGASDALAKEPSSTRVAIVRTGLKILIDTLNHEEEERTNLTPKVSGSFEVHAPKPTDTVKP